MSWPEIRAFAQDHLDAAGSLLAARHREHRAAEPLLSEDFEDADATRVEVALLWAQEHASGAVALRGAGGRVPPGARKNDQTSGANVWVEAAGCAVEEPELVRDLYAFSSQRWVDEGRTRHYALVPKLDDHVGAGMGHDHVGECGEGLGAPEGRVAVERPPGSWSTPGGRPIDSPQSLIFSRRSRTGLEGRRRFSSAWVPAPGGGG